MSEAPPSNAQTRANAELWEPGGLVDAYATRDLCPVEVIILVRYRDDVVGRVLELGCGAGRLTGYLAALAREAHAIDVSPKMVDYTRRAYPHASVEVGDLRDLSRYEAGSFDAVFAPFNVLGVLDELDRPRVLADIRDLLVGGGLFVLSAHNLHYSPSGALTKARAFADVVPVQRSAHPALDGESAPARGPRAQRRRLRDRQRRRPRLRHAALPRRP